MSSEASPQTDEGGGHCGSDRRFVTSSGKPGSVGPNGQNAFGRQDLHDRSRVDDRTMRGRARQASCAADRGVERPDVPQRVRTGLVARTGDCPVFRDPTSISQGVVTYQLRRLRLHGLIGRMAESFRYRVTVRPASPLHCRHYARSQHRASAPSTRSPRKSTPPSNKPSSRRKT